MLNETSQICPRFEFSLFELFLGVESGPGKHQQGQEIKRSFLIFFGTSEDPPNLFLKLFCNRSLKKDDFSTHMMCCVFENVKIPNFCRIHFNIKSGSKKVLELLRGLLSELRMTDKLFF